MTADGTGDRVPGTVEGRGALGQIDDAPVNGRGDADPRGPAGGPIDLSETLLTLASATDQMMEEVYASTAELLERLRSVAETSSTRIDATAAESQARLSAQGERITEGMGRAADRLSASFELAVTRAMLLLETATAGQVNAVRQATEQSVEDARLRMTNVSATATADLEQTLRQVTDEIVAVTRQSASAIGEAVTHGVEGIEQALVSRDELDDLVRMVDGLRREVADIAAEVQSPRRAAWVPRPPP